MVTEARYHRVVVRDGEHEALRSRAEALEAELAATRSAREAMEERQKRLQLELTALESRVQAIRAIPPRRYGVLGVTMAIAATMLAGTVMTRPLSRSEIRGTGGPGTAVESEQAPEFLPAGDYPVETGQCLSNGYCTPGEVCTPGAGEFGRCSDPTQPTERRNHRVPRR